MGDGWVMGRLKHNPYPYPSWVGYLNPTWVTHTHVVAYLILLNATFGEIAHIYIYIPRILTVMGL
jgi:hypothetical protein